MKITEEVLSESYRNLNEKLVQISVRLKEEMEMRDRYKRRSNSWMDAALKRDELLRRALPHIGRIDHSRPTVEEVETLIADIKETLNL